MNYTDASTGGVMTLAKATTNFALRFTGEAFHRSKLGLGLGLRLELGLGLRVRKPQGTGQGSGQGPA